MSLRNPFANRRTREDALDAELRDHVAQVKEGVRDVWRDMRFGARLVKRSPVFAALVLLTLAFAVGANVTVFTIVNAIWLEPRPVQDPDRVVVVTNTVVASDEVADMVSGPKLHELRTMPIFQAVAGQAVGAGNLGDMRPRLRFDELGRSLEPLAVAADYFTVLGLTVRGRDFTGTDDQPGAPAVAIISDELWRGAFDGQSDVIGRTIATWPEPVTIVGIAPRGFRGARLGERADVWIPWALTPRVSANARYVAAAGPEARFVAGMAAGIALARLAPGVTVQEAATAVNAGINPRGSRYRVFPLSSVIGLPGRVTMSVGDTAVLAVVGTMALLVLVAGCATLAVLMLVHLERRRHELAVRLALGCGRARLTRAVLAEVALLGAAGMATALVVAVWTLGLSRSLSLPAGLGLDRLDLSLDWKAVAFALLATVGTMTVAALVPQARFRRPSVAASLTTAAATATRSSLQLRRVLLAIQVAATVVLLVAAGLFVRTIALAFATGAGFDVDHTVFVSVQPAITEFYDPVDNPDGAQSEALQRAAYERLIAGVSETPGVMAVALGEAPIRSKGLDPPAVYPSAVPTPSGEREMLIGLHSGGLGYVDVLGIPVLAGQVPPDGNGTLITESLAVRLWPGEDPVGRYFRRGQMGHLIVGVVPDFVQGSMHNEAAGGLITSATRMDGVLQGVTGIRIAARTGPPAAQVVPELQQLVQRILPYAVRSQVTSGRQLLEADMGRERLGAWFFTGFGLVSLVLGLAGVFGLVAYLAESRARELGVRIALGATPAQVMRATIGTGLVPVAIGAAIGLMAAGLLSDTVAARVHGITPLDPVSYVGAAALMLAGAAAAGLAAALRLRRLSPMDALRAE